MWQVMEQELGPRVMARDVRMVHRLPCSGDE